MDIPFRYGDQTVTIKIKDHNLAGIVQTSLPAALNQPAEVKNALAHPIGSSKLRHLVLKKRPASIAILVADVSRPIPYRIILEPVLQEILTAGIKKEQVNFIIATGAHRPNSASEIKKLFGPLAEQYMFLNHDCDRYLVNLGRLPGGAELFINKRVIEAAMVIIVGCIMPHNLAGFSGGPKLILPGVAGRKTIEQNHGMLTCQGVGPGQITGNPVSRQILDAAQRVGVDFAVNVIINEKNEIIKCLAGDLTASWLAGCSCCHNLYRQNLPAPQQVVVAGAGGYPRDINLYQAVKALINGAGLAVAGGTVVLLARCQEGIGEPVFQQWLEQARSPQDIINKFHEQGFVLGGHKAYLLSKIMQKKEIILISDLAGSQNPVPLLKNAIDWQSAERMLIRKYGPAYRALAVPFAGLVFPLSGQAMPSDK
ncbi:nickel-dependent lactate racemase [Desulfotomaculum varum]